MTAYSQRNIRTSRHLKTAFSCLAALLALSVVSGCSLLNGPEKAEPPQVYPELTAPIFDPADNLTPGVKLPDIYRVTSVISGELLTIQGVQLVTKGTKQIKRYGVSETVRLAGIVAPAPGQPGWGETVAKVNGWLQGKENLHVEGDAKYPIDLDTHRMVQIYFTPGLAKPDVAGTSAPSGGEWNLNRMLVHTGYAVVDLYGATSIDVQKWLNDEEFAKTFVPDSKDTYEVIDPITNLKTQVPKIKPLGLWRLGIVIPQRGTPSLAVGGPMKTATSGAMGKPGAPITGVARTTNRTAITRSSVSKSSTRSVSSATATRPVSPNETTARALN